MQNFEKEPFIKIVKGNNNLTKIIIKDKTNASIEVYLNGAQITSYKNSKGKELLYLSSKAIFQQSKSIRGGIPICWPQFGPGELPQHGFARNQLWNIKDSIIKDNYISIILSLENNEETKKQWDHCFYLEYTINLFNGNDEKLSLELKVINKNENKSFSFTGALHNYFRILDCRKITIHGLKNLSYIDKVNQGIKCNEEKDEVIILGETDRVYLNSPDVIIIKDILDNSIIELKKNSFIDCVLWNPWIEKSKQISDLGENEWINYICVESALVSSPITLKPGEQWIGKQEIKSKL
jgi:glucose-6-phosphate 1-epimerase